MRSNGHDPVSPDTAASPGTQCKGSKLMIDYARILRDGAGAIEVDGTPSQVGPSPAVLRAAAAEIERLRHPFRNADQVDWKQLFLMLPDSGHGKFWKAVMTEMAAALGEIK